MVLDLSYAGGRTKNILYLTQWFSLVTRAAVQLEQ